jgi:hypothetical protein
MFTAILRFLLRLFTRRRAKGVTRSETAAATVTTSKPAGREMRNSGFDMRSEIAKLAERIVEPVSGKVPVQDMEPIVGQVRHTFEQLNTERAAADTNFEDMAIRIVEPIQPNLSEADFARVVDRLRGAMAGFCQSDRGQSTP